MLPGRDLPQEQSMSIEFQAKSIATDDEGFLLAREDWSEDLMHFMAQKDGLTLTDEHIFIIQTVRRYYEEYATTPAMRSLIALIKKEGHTELASSLKLARLFPKGAAKTAARYAGLPKPVKCI